jgi:hypothetical protein
VKFWFGLVGLLLIAGCSERVSVPHADLEQAIISTQKERVTLADNSTLLITATHLNNIARYSNLTAEQIVISVYYSPADPAHKLVLKDPLIKIDGMSMKYERLDESDERLSWLPSTNIWSSYYLVTAPKIARDEINLAVEIYPFSQALLTLPANP